MADLPDNRITWDAEQTVRRHERADVCRRITRMSQDIARWDRVGTFLEGVDAVLEIVEKVWLYQDMPDENQRAYLEAFGGSSLASSVLGVGESPRGEEQQQRSER